MIRCLRVDSQEIVAASARRDNGRIEAFDNSNGWIFYNPLRGASPSAARKVVPATYDIDWTAANRSEEHTSEIQSLMRISHAVCCLKNKKKEQISNHH